MPQGIGSSAGGSTVGLDHPGSRSQESPAFEGAEKVDRWMDSEWTTKVERHWAQQSD